MDENLRVYFQITTLSLLTFFFLFCIFEVNNDKEITMKYINFIT